MLPQQRELGAPLFVRELGIRDELQRPRLVLVAPQHALALQRPDVLEIVTCWCELIGQFLHRRRIPVQMPVVADRDDDVELAGRQVHERCSCPSGAYDKTMARDPRCTSDVRLTFPIH